MDEQVSNELLNYIEEFLNEYPLANIFNNEFESFLLDEAEKNNHQHIVRFVESLQTNNRGVAKEQINGGHRAIRSTRDFTLIEYEPTNRRKEPINGTVKASRLPTTNPKNTDDVAVVDEMMIGQLPRLYDMYVEEPTRATATKRNRLINQQQNVIVEDEPLPNYRIRQPRQGKPVISGTSRIAHSGTSKSVSKETKRKKGNLQLDKRMDMETVADDKDLVKVKTEFPDSVQPTTIRKRIYKTGR